MRKALRLLTILCCFFTFQATAQLTFTIADQNVNCEDNTFCVDVDVSNFSQISGMQWALQWDPALFSYSSHQHFLSGDPLFNLGDTTTGFLSFVWFSTDFLNGLTLPDDSTILTLCLEPLGNAGDNGTVDFAPQPGQLIVISDIPNGPLDVNTQVAFNSSSVTIFDNVNPTISCPNDTTVFESVINGIAPVADDNCAIETLTYSLGGATSGAGANDASGSTLLEGMTTVSYVATDYAGQTASCSFEVTYNDTSTLDPNVLYFNPQITHDCANDRVTIEVQVINFDSVASMQFGINWDTSIIKYISHTDLLPPSANFITAITDDGTLGLIWVPNPSPGGSTLTDNTAIFSIEFDLTGIITLPLLTFEDLGPLNLEIGSLRSFAMGGRLDTTQWQLLPGNVTVLDMSPPVLSGCPGDQLLVADAGLCGTNVTWTPPTATDDCGNPTVTSTHMPGDFFSVGVDTVMYIATDGAGNTDTCSFVITVQDNERPTLSCPGDTTLDADAGMCGATVAGLGLLSSADNCTIAMTTFTLTGATTGGGFNDASGTFFNLDTTTVSYVVTDDSGNSETCSFRVIIRDMEQPSITCPTDISQNVDAGNCSATVTVPAPTTSDNCPGFTITNDFNNTTDASGVYPVGVTTVTWTITDTSGNTNSCMMTVTVTDNEMPSLTCPANITQIANMGSCDAMVTVPAPTFGDNCPGATITNDFNNTTDASGTYPVGVTTVTWTVTDAAGLTNTCTMTVTVNDDNDPTIFCPAAINQNVDPGNCTAAITMPAPSFSDNCPGATITNDFNNSTDASGNYPVGTTVVTWTVTDASGNTATCTVDVTVTDNEMPSLTCPVLIVRDADPGACSAAITVPSPSVTENCPGFTLTNDFNGTNNASGTYPVGTTIVTWTVTDVGGNTDNCMVTITVNDNQLPSITCPNDTTINTAAAPIAVNNIDPLSNDNCGIATTAFKLRGDTNADGSGSASGQSFNQGTTTVTYIVTDVNGLIDSCQFIVTVNISVSDLIDCPGNVTVNNDPGNCSAVVNGIAPIYLVNPASITLGYELFGATTTAGMVMGEANGVAFNVGITRVFYTATIGATSDTCSFFVTVIDNEDPVFSNCPMDITVANATGMCNQDVSWTIPTATDNCSAAVVASHAPGSNFPVGTTTVQYIATDPAGNTDTCRFTITVTDNEDPVFSNCPTDISVSNAAGMCNQDVSWTAPTATDNCSAAVVASHMPGDNFPVGTTTVQYVATDPAGNTDTCRFTITVTDDEDPVFSTCPTDIAVDAAAGSCTAAISWSNPTVTDNCSISTLNGTHASGDDFSVGNTTVEFVATDPSGNTDTCRFIVTVRDTTPPTFAGCPPANIVVNNIAGCRAEVNFEAPIPTDDCSTVMVTSTHMPGDTFDVGVTTVTYTAVDTSGNQSQCVFDVVVTDQTPPMMNCGDSLVISVDGTVIEDPNNILQAATLEPGCVGIKLSFTEPSATDDCVSNIVVTQTDVTGLSNGSTFPVGTTLLQYSASDTSGNVANCELKIIVNPLPTPVISFLPTTPCLGDDLIMTVGNFSNATYSWTGPDDFSSSDEMPVINNITAAQAGDYMVTVTLASGCTVSATATFTPNTGPDITATSNSPVCNSAIELGVTVNSGTATAFQWTGPSGFSSVDQDIVLPNATEDQSGLYIVNVTGSDGCVSSDTVEVVVSNLPTPEVISDCDGAICLGEACTLIGTEYTTAIDSYNWLAQPADTGGLPTNTNDNSVIVTPTSSGLIVYKYWVERNGCTSDTAEIVLSVVDEPTAQRDTFEVEFNTTLENFNVLANDIFNVTVGFTTSITTTTANGALVDNGDGTFTYTPNRNFIGTDQFVYEICHNCGDQGLCSQAIVTIEVIFPAGGECDIPNLISPNDDGANDMLFINCLEQGIFNNNEMVIYNQWGDEVFRAAPYRNDWMGTFEGKDLPDGTYYYIFKLDSSAATKPRTGFITIFR